MNKAKRIAERFLNDPVQIVLHGSVQVQQSKKANQRRAEKASARSKDANR